MEANGRYAIPTELVGLRAALNNGVYTDAYLMMLNDKYPLFSILGEKAEQVAKKNKKVLESLIADTSLRNKNSLNILEFILIGSARAKMWQPEIIGAPILKALGYDARGCLSEIKEAPANIAQEKNPYVAGVQLAANIGLILPNSYENNLILLPSQKAIELFAENRLK